MIHLMQNWRQSLFSIFIALLFHNTLPSHYKLFRHIDGITKIDRLSNCFKLPKEKQLLENEQVFASNSVLCPVDYSTLSEITK